MAEFLAAVVVLTVPLKLARWDTHTHEAKKKT
jgi:hypothetical protein